MSSFGKFICLMILVCVIIIAVLHTTVISKNPDFFKDSRRVMGKEHDDLEKRVRDIEERLQAR